jgi:hypothetical protein
MYSRFAGKTVFSQRHELDLLENHEDVDASPAQPEELPTMIMLASMVPGVKIKPATVERVYDQHPACIFPFRCGGRIVGGMAFLYLNEDGLDRLLLDELNFSDPDPKILARPGEAPTALYIWALAARGRAAAGMANVSVWLRQEPFSSADYYAQPSTQHGTRILLQVGFEPANSFQHDLWTYRRLCNRVAMQPMEALC